MFSKKKSSEERKLDRLLDRAYDRLSVETEAYRPDRKEVTESTMELIERLTMIKKETYQNRKVSPDTLLIVGGNLLGILIMVGYEHSHVLTSKALSLLMKTK